MGERSPLLTGHFSAGGEERCLLDRELDGSQARSEGWEREGLYFWHETEPGL